MAKTTWRKKIAEAMEELKDGPIIASTLTEEQWDREFNDGYGGTEGDAFTVWTEKRVYFPTCYDGSEDVGSAPRDPCDEACNHVGGG